MGSASIDRLAADLCFEEDDYTRSKFYEEPRWVAHLSDGRRVISDDNRPGLLEPRAWLRLREFVFATGINVVGLDISFRSRVQDPLPRNADGYFFCRGVLASPCGAKIHRFVVGHLQPDGWILAQSWNVPELTQAEVDFRRVESVKPEMLIINHDSKRQGIPALSPA